ncbi:MAG: hypothetical protein IMZ52_01885 [Actinobacteria bacterium]|nr:hypothetical protein [Actinomycetota bacterium]
MPDTIENLLSQLASEWYYSEMRPRISEKSLEHWDKLITDWSENQELPLLIRKPKEGRGQSLVHIATRRELIPTDNSPANWSFFHAYQKIEFDLKDIRKLFDDGEIPIAFLLSKYEGQNAVYKKNMQRSETNINRSGWTVCHINPVGLNKNKKIIEMSIEELKQHFKDFLSPSNMFLIPSDLEGFGELPHLIQEMKNKKNIS